MLNKTKPIDNQEHEVLPIPCGHLVLVKIEKFKVVSSSIIALPDDANKRHEDGRQTGYLVAVGPNAWPESRPWAKKGDRIYFKRYAGIEFRTLDDTLYRIMNDDDVWAVLPPNYTAGVKQSV